MIIDTSAVVAVIREEPDSGRYERALAEDGPHRMSAANCLEAGIVVDARRDPVASRELDVLLRTGSVRIEPLTENQARIAREAYRDFGRGSGHPAKLNFGDCFAYALAKDSDEPLLYKWQDTQRSGAGPSGSAFGHTDVTPAVAPP